eukprot:TRINITY_DN9590_c0_g1_i1.p1 TRINITY_DN9590_c0_g1~~TRINITY_DN9590_c0_g1_i1.p1  ORF type:complete len:550 (+),score=121.71 TRINITY_DN9590_c0_g1_i1:75-1724(+)
MGRSRADTRGVDKEVVVPEHASSGNLVRHYESLKKLGAGNFGTVHLVHDNRSGLERVCKTTSISGLPREAVELMKKEIQHLKTLDHPSILKLFEYAEDAPKQQIIMILEYIEGGDCLKLLETYDNLIPEPLVARLMYQLMVALSYCHKNNVIHRDIKPDNMMLVYPEGSDLPDCKLIDFGLAARSQGALTLFAGTPKYMAPEALQRKPYTSKADIWSSAITALHMLTGDGPFSSPWEKTVPKYQNFSDIQGVLNKRSSWTSRSHQCGQFIQGLLRRDPSSRPSAEEALSFDWVHDKKPPLKRFDKDMVKSFVSYTAAPPVVRCCLLAIATRIGSADIDSLGHAFLSADEDGDAQLGDEDLSAALEDVEGWKWWDDWRAQTRLNVSEFLEASDLNHSGGLCFTEFVAAALYGRHSNLEELAQKAFEALDEDRDGWVSTAQIRLLFRERDREFLSSLPQHRPFDCEEWQDSVELFSTLGDSDSDGLAGTSSGGHAKSYRSDATTSVPWLCAAGSCAQREDSWSSSEEEITIVPSPGRHANGLVHTTGARRG